MRSLVLFTFLLVTPFFSFANEGWSPEEYFVRGTELLKPNSAEFDSGRGLQYLLLSADKKYEHAPFGLCIALSTEKTILDLEHAYSWCYVASRIGSKYSKLASTHLQKIGTAIENEGGEGALSKAKSRGVKAFGQ